MCLSYLNEHHDDSELGRTNTEVLYYNGSKYINKEIKNILEKPNEH